MKLSDIKSTIIKESVLVENLGNLAQLGIGPLINLLKQTISTSKKYGASAGNIGKKFATQEIGSTSDVIDIGVIKGGMTGIRKAYKANDGARAFALYIGGSPVLFAIFDGHDLGGSSRIGKLAYDLTAFKDTIDQIDNEANAGNKDKWNYRPQQTTLTSYKEKEPYRYGRTEDDPAILKYQGDASSTGDLSTVVNLIMNIASRVGQPVTGKLVTADLTSIEKRRNRYFTRQEIVDGKRDLMNRLKLYKNSKNPTAATIEDFVAMTLKNPGKSARFGGVTYHLKASAYNNIDPHALLSGKPFLVSYKSTDPGVYDSLEITYAFDNSAKMLTPIFATWYDRNDPANRHNRQEAALDPAGYAKIKLTVGNLDNKDIVMKKVLELFKAEKHKDILEVIKSLKRAGKDWPELDVIEKGSLKALEQSKATRG